MSTNPLQSIAEDVLRAVEAATGDQVGVSVELEGNTSLVATVVSDAPWAQFTVRALTGRYLVQAASARATYLASVVNGGCAYA